MEGTVPQLILRDPGETETLGKRLAALFAREHPGCLLLRGALGAGKTALTRALVRALPGGGDAEPSSPSFTICNIYCTAPQVHHFDLYRLEPGTPFDALAESFDDDAVLTVVEWPEHMAHTDAPRDGVELSLLPGASETGRLAECTALGPRGTRVLSMLQQIL